MNDELPTYPTLVRVGGRGRVTLPKAARERLSLYEGTQLFILVGRTALELVPAVSVERDHIWSLSGSFRERVEAAEADAAAGRSAIVDEPRTIRHAMRNLLSDEN